MPFSMAGMKLRGMAPRRLRWRTRSQRRGLRLHANLAVAELAVAAGLLFVASRRLDLGADGLTIGHLGGLEGDLGVVALFEAADDGLDVRLAGAGDEEFVGLRIAEEANEQVLFHELVDGGGELVLVGAALGSMA